MTTNLAVRHTAAGEGIRHGHTPAEACSSRAFRSPAEGRTPWPERRSLLGRPCIRHPVHRPSDRCRRLYRRGLFVRQTYNASVRQGDHKLQRPEGKRKPQQALGEESRQSKWFVLDVVHCINGFLGVRLLCVPHESKPTAAASVSILDNNLWGHENTSLVLDTLHSCWFS